MSTLNGRWIPTPFVTISLGILGSAKSNLIFSTLTNLSNKKYISDVNIIQTSQTTVKYTVNLTYYPGTFNSGSKNGVPDVLETRFKLAMESQETQKLYIEFGYRSNSPYTASEEKSPTYVGLITDMQSTVERNCIRYTIQGYGVDVALGYFITIDKDTNKYINKDTNIEKFIKETLLQNGNISVDTGTFRFNIEIEDVNLNKTFFELLLEGLSDTSSLTYGNAYQQMAESYYNQYAGIPSANRPDNFNSVSDVESRIKSAANDLQEYYWNKIKNSLNVDPLCNSLLDKSIMINKSSANVEDSENRNQFSVYEVIEIINRMLNYNMNGKYYNLRCVVEPWFNGSGYDGTIRIFNSTPNVLSKREFFWGSWSKSKGYLSNQNNVVKWECNYNSTAMLFSNTKFKTSLYGNINTDLELTLDEDGNVHYNLISSQTESKGNTDYRASIDKNTQYDMVISAINTVLDYPYEATITVLGIPNPPLRIAKDTVKVNVFVNGSKHFTSGTYMVTGYSHQIGSNGFTTTYNLIKIPNKATNNEINKISSEIIDKQSATNPTLDKAMSYYANLNK